MCCIFVCVLGVMLVWRLLFSGRFNDCVFFFLFVFCDGWEVGSVFVFETGFLCESVISVRIVFFFYSEVVFILLVIEVDVLLKDRIVVNDSIKY